MAKSIHWDFVKPLFRAGYSLRAIATKYKAAHDGETVSIEGIRKYAKKAGWKKDLKKDIQDSVDRKLAEAAVDESNATDRSDEEFVEAAANLATQVVLTHRNDGKSLRRLVTGLADELSRDKKEQRVIGRGASQKVIEMRVPLKDRAMTVKNLAYALSKAVGIERVSHNLDREDKQGGGIFKITTYTPDPDDLPDDI